MAEKIQMTPIEKIAKYAGKYEISLQRGPMPRDKLFMFERVKGGNLLEVKLPFVDDDFVSQQQFVHCMVVDVYVLEARPDWGPKWGWEPNTYRRGNIGFYHTDFDSLIEYAAEWLEAHADPIAPPHQVQHGLNYTVLPIKCVPIGHIKHYTTTPGFEEGNLTRKPWGE